MKTTTKAAQRDLTAKRIRSTRNRLGMTQDEFARAYNIPLGHLKRYESASWLPQLEIRSYLKVIEAEPEMIRRLVAG